MTWVVRHEIPGTPEAVKSEVEHAARVVEDVVFNALCEINAAVRHAANDRLARLEEAGGPVFRVTAVHADPVQRTISVIVRPA